MEVEESTLPVDEIMEEENENGTDAEENLREMILDAEVDADQTGTKMSQKCHFSIL